MFLSTGRFFVKNKAAQVSMRGLNMNAGASKPFLTRVQESLFSCSWYSVIWSINGFFILITVLFAHIPHRGQGLTKALGLFTLQYERNLATYWEAWCLLLVAILAFEHFSRSEKGAIYERQAWMGLAILAAGLSLDELGGLHERSDFVFSSWGVDGLIPIAVPALVILLFTLHAMSRLSNRHFFWLTFAACIVLGSVVLQENLEHALKWPWWAKGLRFGVEEGTELLGIFLLLCAVVSPKDSLGKSKSITHLAPRAETLIRLRPAIVVVALLSFIPLAILHEITLPIRKSKGVPTIWLPSMLLNLTFMVSWACVQAGEAYRKRFLFASLLALFFSLDQTIVFQRVVDVRLIRGGIENFMFPCMAAVCMWIPTLRTRFNILLLGALFPLGLLLIPSSELLPSLVIPLQSLVVFYVLVSGLMATSVVWEPVKRPWIPVGAHGSSH
jgi:hypothetical protein